MSNHFMGMLDRIRFAIPLAAVDILHFSIEIVFELRRAFKRHMVAEDGVYAGGDKVLSNGDGLLTHPLGSTSGCRQIADVVAESACFDHLGGGQQDTAVVDAGAEMQYRRNTDGLTDLSQSRTTVNGSSARRQQSMDSCSDCRTTGGQNDDIVFDQFLDQGDMFFVMLGTGVVAAHHTGDTAN